MPTFIGLGRTLTGPMLDPMSFVADRLGPGGRCLLMPNGGNLGDALIAAATIQKLEGAGIAWSLIRGQRRTVTPQDVLVLGGGGSLVEGYEGGVACLRSLLSLGTQVVVFPQSVNGHGAFWAGVGAVTVFCRESVSLAYLQQFPNVSALPAHDMAAGLDLGLDPFTTPQAIRATVAAQPRRQVLHAFRRDGEAPGEPPQNSFDISAVMHPAMTSVDSIKAHACSFLSAVALHSEIHTNRLHVAIAGGLLGIPTVLSDNRYGKNRAVYEATLRERFSTIRFVEAGTNAADAGR